MAVSISSTYQDATVPTIPGAGLSVASTPTDTYSVNQQNEFIFGTGTDAAQIHLHGRWTVPNAGTVVFDLNAVMDDVFGVTVNGVELKGCFVHNESTTPGDDINVGGDAAAGGIACPVTLAVGDAWNVGPNGWIASCNPIDGWPLGAAASDTFELSCPGGNPIVCEVFFLIE